MLNAFDFSFEISTCMFNYQNNNNSNNNNKGNNSNKEKHHSDKFQKLTDLFELKCWSCDCSCKTKL